jgi:Tol biopolymer transport system component
MRNDAKGILAMATLTFCLLPAQTPQSTQESQATTVQFKAAQHKEEVEGDLPRAIELYKKLARSTDRATAAKALLRLGNCYEKLGDAQARATYQRVLREFADQPQETHEANLRIAKLGGSSDSSSRQGMVFRQMPFRPDSSWMHTDGRHIAYIKSATGDIVVTDVNGSRARVAAGPKDHGLEGSVSSPVLSPDGKHLAYRAHLDRERQYSELVLVNLEAGERHTLLKTGRGTSFDIHDFTPDGTQVLIISKDRHGSVDSLQFVSTLDGRITKIRESRAGSMESARVSADGRYIAFSDRSGEAALNLNIVIVRADGGGEIKLAEHRDTDRPVVWLRSGGILFSCTRTADTSLWLQSMSGGVPAGAPVLVRGNMEHFEDLGAGQNGTVYLGREIARNNTFLVDYDPMTGRITEQPQPVSRQWEGRLGAGDWSGDGKQLAYLIPPAGHDLYEGAAIVALRALATDRERRIVPKIAILNFISSYDGRSLLAEGIDDRQLYGVFRVDTETGESTPIVTGDHNRAWLQPIWVSADDKVLYYRRSDGAARQVTMMRRDLAQGEEKALVSTLMPGNIHVAPGGDRLAVREENPSRLSVFDVSTGAMRPFYQAPPSDRIVDVKWMEDARSMLFFLRPVSAPRQSGTETLYRIQAEGGAPQKLPGRTDLNHWLRVRPDNRQILYTSVEQRLELWSLENYELKP